MASTAARAHEARIARRFRAWLLEGLAARARPGARPAAGGAQLCGACLADDDEERGAESPRAAQGPGLASACLCCAWLWLLAWRGLGAAWGHAAALGRPAAAARAAQAEFDRAFPSDVRDEAEPDGTRRRVLTIRCPGVQHEDISVESVCNGCAVAIARGGPGGGPGGGCSRLFQWQLSEGLFSLVDELARFEHGGVLHLVLRESPSQGRRAVCLPQLFRLDAGEEGACGDSSGPDEGSEVGEAPSAAGSEVNGDHPESDAAYDEDARSDSSQVSGGDPPSGAASVDGWEKVGACSDGEEGLAEVRPGAWPL
ncbi:unnamed protein product [Prorocentrum cordatum]|uniref:SHSP domain-containing protein n=1 Tax=Prorocentrum cordatum TaxID=2364126 RepID=A0ABN9QN11_9DINO|nr:unnamed protein product [Polarella glacialis]